MNVLEINSRKELRSWLLENHKDEKECWVPISVSEKRETILYLDLVEEALCFGWIDSTKKKDNQGRLIQRISPRSKKSNWTELNKERIRRLERLGLLHESGYEALPDMSEESFKIADDILIRIESDEITSTNFHNFPELYRRIRIDTIQSVRKDTELYEKRLEKFIKMTAANQLYGEWNDKGRLL